MNHHLSWRTAAPAATLLAFLTTLVFASPAFAGPLAPAPVLAIGTKTKVAVVALIVLAVAAGAFFWFRQRSK